MFGIKQIIVLFLSVIATTACFAQSKSTATVLRRKTIEQNEVKNVQPAGQRDDDVNNDNIQWLRVVYRDLDLSKSHNGAIKNTADDRKDLFTILLNLIANGNIKAYEYQDGAELFDERTLVNAPSLFDRFDININDIPSRDVEHYYIIEHYYFDSRASRFNRIVKAICPVLERGGVDNTKTVRYPMFWVMIDDIRPYINSVMVMTDDNNNAVRHSIENFFDMNMYNGELYKTQNTANKTLVQLYPDPKDLGHARDSIEQSLVAFEKGLWTPAFNHSGSVKAHQNKPQPKPAIQKISEEKTTPTRAGAARSVRRRHTN
ncbi:MAG: gliding motility protein GldN [Muribaculaceae bacterium]|nr:gliding motility protein GldN [Muribaculaceae bacterium]MDE6352402.1 gliding motility protein GldN [Muribaculaceae bacterium]MDE6642489.1 gliding motility protein GldN [Muribaculaceae bacterium]